QRRPFEASVESLLALCGVRPILALLLQVHAHECRVLHGPRAEWPGRSGRGRRMTHRFFPSLLVLLFASGCAALIYQVVWFQLLGLVIGASAPSVGVLLGTFMGGLCIGSVLPPLWIRPERHPLRVFAMLDAGIDTHGIVVLHALPGLEALYGALAGGGAGIALRAVVAALCLL